MFGLLRDASVHAIFAGIQPTEVWLGPKEARILEVEMNWQSAEGRLVHTNANQSAMIRGDMEGAQLMGLRVRLMAKDGVRVGISWPNVRVSASGGENEKDDYECIGTDKSESKTEYAPA